MIFDIKGDHCMVDLETLDTVPGGVILSIGAVMFNTDGLIPTSEFYTVINTDSCVKAGLTTNSQTVEWWNKQLPEARKVLIDANFFTSSDQLMFGLGKFSVYLDRFNPVGIWGNGSDFDNAFLSVAYCKAGLPAPWDHRNNRCFRTLKSLVGDTVVKPDSTGVFHNALDDARYQAHYAASMFQQLAKFNKLLQVENGLKKD